MAPWLACRSSSSTCRWNPPSSSSLAKQLIAAAPETLITVPFGDLATLAYLETLGVAIETLVPSGDSDLSALRRSLFAARQPLEREAQGDVRLFSAPGEGRECVEIARRILDEVRGGVRFDEIAVFLRSPREYLGLVENAFERAGINAWFDRGARRPHPSGRAFLAILSCAVERLSAVRFAEYLSLAQVPEAGAAESAEVLPPADDLIAGFTSIETPADPTDAVLPLQPERDDQSPIVEGGLRAPWKWERMIVEASVVGGDPERWRRRLRGLREGYEARIKEEGLREDPESPRLVSLERDRQNLAHLSNFALPIVETLASWPAHATWGEWLERFGELAPRVLRRPARVLRVLGELRAMAAIGPVGLEEARDVLAERLRTFDEQPPADRYGRVFVGSPHQARGRAFKVVFVPGLAERLFPQKLREDPLLLDRLRCACRSRSRCANRSRRARRAPRRAGRSRQDRAAPAPARRRRRHGSPLAVLSASRRRRRPPAGALLLRPRRHARHRRQDPAPRGAPAGRRDGRRRQARLAGAGEARGSDRRGRARSRHAPTAHRHA